MEVIGNKNGKATFPVPTAAGTINVTEADPLPTEDPSDDGTSLLDPIVRLVALTTSQSNRDHRQQQQTAGEDKDVVRQPMERRKLELEFHLVSYGIAGN